MEFDGTICCPVIAGRPWLILEAVVRESVKAALWSIFIFPGSGHFYLKKPVTGTIMVSIAIVALLIVLIGVVERANQIADKIIRGEVPLDLSIITDMVSKQAAQSNSLALDFATYVLIAIWVIAAIDAYRLGRAKDNLNN